MVYGDVARGRHPPPGYKSATTPGTAHNRVNDIESSADNLYIDHGPPANVSTVRPVSLVSVPSNGETSYQNAKPANHSTQTFVLESGLD